MAKISFPTTGCSLIQLKKNNLIVILLLFSYLSGSSQPSTYTVVDAEGYVKGRNGDVVPGVKVKITNKENKHIAYCITNDRGFFSISYPKALSDGTIHFTCLGFKELIIPLSKFKNNTSYILSEEALQLNEVTVRVPPITVKSDTLTYNVNSFRDASDRNIEDIIKKLPGIRVTEDGKIFYNGESINKFYIEGLDLLSGRYALASRNISPDDVVSVNIYENHQPKEVLRDIAYSDKAALNLKLKNKSMLRPIGYLKASVGIDTEKNALWTGEAFGLLVSPKSQILLSAKGNNSGNSYQDETKTLADGETQENTIIFDIYSDTPFGNAKIPTSRYYDNRSGSASINSIFRIGEKTTINTIADYTNDYFSYINNETITYALANDEIVSISETADSDPHLRETKFIINLENNAKNKYISNKLSVIGHSKSNNYNIINEKFIDQNVQTRDYNIHNVFNGIFKLSNNVIDFKSDLQLGSTPTNQLTATANGYNIILQNINGYHVRNREVFGYSKLINARSFIGFKSSFNLEYDKFQSQDLLSPQKRNNDISGYKITTTVEPIYQCNLPNNLTINIGTPIKLSNLKYHNLENNKSYPTNRFDIDLKASLKYNFPFNLKTAVTIGRTNRLGNISDYIMVPFFTTFRQSNILGSGKLNERSSWYAHGNLSYRNIINGLFSSATIMLRRSYSNRLGGINITNNDDIISITKIHNNKGYSLNAEVSVSKKIFSCNTSFSFEGDYEFIRKDMIRQADISEIDMNNYTYRFKINSNPWNNHLIMILDLKHSYSLQKAKMLDSDNHTYQTTVNITLATHPYKNFEIGTKGYLNMNNVNNQISKNSAFFDAYTRYSFQSFDFELSAKNITDTRIYGYTYIKDSDIYNYSFHLRPLEILFSLRYSF